MNKATIYTTNHYGAFIITHKEKRNRMDKAIMEIVIPFLRSEKFKGSFPHFRREKYGQLNLLTFQFSLYSPKFVVEISNFPINGMSILQVEVLMICFAVVLVLGIFQHSFVLLMVFATTRYKSYKKLSH